jgi:biotin carboxylase
VKRILLLSATTGYQLRSFNDAAERLGVTLVFATDRCHHLDDPWRDRAIPVRFHDLDASAAAVAAAAREQPLDGLVVVGDRPTALAAAVASRLGLPGNAPAAAAASANKRAARDCFAAAGLITPWRVVLPLSPEGGGSGAAVHERVRFPCVLKPVGLSASRGVIRANSPSEFHAAWSRIAALLRRPDVRAAQRGAGHGSEILVEGFVPGREVAVEGLLTNGALQVLAIFDKPDPLDGPFFEETIYVTPSSLDAASRAALAATVAQGVAALGLTHGAIHAECRISDAGVFILEIAARPIGGLCSRALRFTPASGGAVWSLEDLLLRHACGEDVAAVRREADASAVMMIPIPARGVLKRVDGEADARATAGVDDVVITAKQDQLLEPLPEAGSYLGFIFARGATAPLAEAAVRAAHARLTFTLEPAIEMVRE